MPRRRFLWIAAGSIVLAVAAGLALGWIRGQGNHDGYGLAADTRAPANPPKQREAELKKKVDEAGDVDAAIELGLLYLKERPLTAAKTFFQDLGKIAEDPKKSPLRTLGYLGHAMVLAYEDHPGMSNKAFIAVLVGGPRPVDKSGFDKLTVKALMDRNPSLKVLLENPPLREAIADALQHNYINSPQQRLPPLLEKLRKPWNPSPS